jgi:ABC-type Fe3+-hydroxamate transport system substrate-binding protein
MAQHRPIQERMAELQQQMVALQAKQNKDAVNADPKVQALDAEITTLNTTALKWKRWEKEADKKVSDFQARVAEWVNRGEQAEEWLSQYKQDLATLKEKRNLVANEVAKGM